MWISCVFEPGTCEKAKIYLRQTNEPITAVAEKVGFSDYRIFTKIFKGIVGETPSQFRK